MHTNSPTVRLVPINFFTRYFNLIQNHKIIFMIFQAILLLFHILGFAFSLNFKMICFKKLKVSQLYKVLLTVGDVLVMLGNTVGFYNISSSPDLMIKFISSKSTALSKSIKLHFIFCIVLNFLALGFSFHALGKTGWDVCLSFIFGMIILFWFQIVLLSILSLEIMISNELMDANMHLLEAVSDNSQSKLELLLKLPQRFNDLYEVVDTFNRHFKFYFVLAIVNMIVNLLKAWISIAEFNLKRDTSNFHYDITSINEIINICYWLKYFSEVTVTAWIGETLEQEGQKTTNICYLLQHKLPLRSQSEHDQLIREELNILLDESKSRKVYLHAGGFFKINWGILGTIAATVAMYSVVITQFALNI